MATNTVKSRIKHAYKAEADWKSSNPVLLTGEVAYSSDKNNKYKVGNGSSKWSELAYVLPTPTDIGLGNVNNTADSNKSVKYATSANSATTATTANRVANTGVASGNIGSHVWFSDASTETARVSDDNFKYNPSSNLLSTNISGNAATASAVAWGNVTGKPDVFTPSSHTHDDRYYTESEIDSKLNTKENKLTQASMSTALNLLGTGSSTPMDADYYISQYSGGGTTTTTYHRRPMSALWSYIKSKADTVYATLTHKHSATDITSGTLSTDRLPAIPVGKLSGVIDSSNLPSYVDDVVEKDGVSNFPKTGEPGKIYVDTKTNLTYRWGGTTYVEISPSLALGITSTTAYRGDLGNTAYAHSQTAHAPSNAEKNAIVGIKQNGKDITVSTDRKVDLQVPILDTTDTTGSLDIPTYSSRIVSCEDQLKNMDSTLSQMNTSVTQLNNDMDSVQDDTTELTTKMITANSQLAMHDQKVQALQSQVVSLQNTIDALNGNNNEMIENQIDYQEYTLLGGKVKVISGSAIRTGVGKNYIALFTAEQLKDYFGVTVNTTRLSISTFNGDDASQAVQFYAPENWQGSIYQYFSAVVSGNIRINYRMVYVYE